jgi:hypothetical protein
LRQLVAAYLSPLPVLRERVRVRVHSCTSVFDARNHPHPGPLPEYRERGKIRRPPRGGATRSKWAVRQAGNHELTDLVDRYTGVKNLNVAVHEWEDQVVFLHRIVEGGTDRSYGIHVARLAGLPKEVLDRARQLLGELAVQHIAKPKISRRGKADKDPGQLPLFVDPAVELMQTLASLKVDELTPMAAFELVRAWKAKYGR